MTELPLVPAPRSFVPSYGLASGKAVLNEALVPQLGFVPRFVAEEAYELEFDEAGARLRALSPAGLQHGRTTWNTLSALETFPAGKIEDEPRFRWRGLMLDCSRHFYPVTDIKALLDKLAELKLNRFHWHLVDDQGWRLEIPGYPKFTQVGAWRTQPDGKLYGGFYSKAEVVEIVAYAAQKSIVVVPEIELPGHSLAALASYPELSCSGAPEKVETRWGIFDGVYCASSEPAARILEDVLEEVCRLFPKVWRPRFSGGSSLFCRPAEKLRLAGTSCSSTPSPRRFPCSGGKGPIWPRRPSRRETHCWSAMSSTVISTTPTPRPTHGTFRRS